MKIAWKIDGNMYFQHFSLKAPTMHSMLVFCPSNYNTHTQEITISKVHLKWLKFV